MTTYEILGTKNLHSLIEDVNTLIKAGWHPLGGVVFDGKQYLQAMILEK